MHFFAWNRTRKQRIPTGKSCLEHSFSTLYYKEAVRLLLCTKNNPIKEHFLNFFLCKWENIVLYIKSLFPNLLTNEYADAIISAYAIFGYVLVMPENGCKCINFAYYRGNLLGCI